MKAVASKAHRVEGEIGRFQFLLYRLQAESGEYIVRSEDWFARCGALQRTVRGNCQVLKFRAAEFKDE